MANTVEIIGGVGETTSRMWLKKEMERFGSVDVCHMGNRSNPGDEPPWVRFVKPTEAEEALNAINAGQVFLDGLKLQAQWKSGRRVSTSGGGIGGGSMRDAPAQRRDLEVSSRDLFMEQERQRIRGRGGGDRDRERGRKRSRSRSRSGRRRRGRDSRSRSNTRSRSRGRRRR
eukprot:TRINITY_DN77453_c0_g1_i1.p1 TRINITY_DN77453_c0_g1~~TRINITY_DN77453_c0_g1_i1.p1  ORF type:complete len:172 (-),score=27.37 TRINITY_DN77453_c0_g1_i1:75-590(-)